MLPPCFKGLVNGEPDLDALSRLTKATERRTVNITFDQSSPPLQCPHFRMCPFSSRSTLFQRRAFWSLYLAASLSARLADVWRSFWAQRLLWLLDDTVAFLGPNAHRLRNDHSFLR